MNKTRKLASLLLALVMVLGMVGSAMAGSITIENAANVTVEGKTFNAYKILDLDLVGESGYVYTVPAGLEDFYAAKFSLDSAAGDFDYQVVTKIAALENDDLFAFVSEALVAAKEAGITAASQTGAAGAKSVKISDLALGYYVIEDAGSATPISALMLGSTDPDMKVTLKADKPTIDKKIDGDHDTDNSTNGLVDYNNGAIGDNVPYILTSSVPDMTGYTKYFFVVTDTLSKGLEFNNDVAITIGEQELTVGEDYTVTVEKNDDGTTSVKIVFINFIQYKEQKGAKVTINYSATIDEDAVIGVTGNPNKVVLEYSNNPNVKPEGENEPTEKDPTGVTPDEITRTFVTEIELNKVDDAGNALAGAQFELTGKKLNKVIVIKETYTVDENGTYYKLKNGTYTTEVPSETNSDKYASTTVKYVQTTNKEIVTTSETVKATATTGPDGKIVFSGLSAGEYTITEIKAPDGYNLLNGPINVVIGWTAPGSEYADCTWTYTWSGAATGNGNSVTIVNKTGTVLPSTGGMGTTLLYIAGSILVVGAFVLMITKRRVTEK